MANGNKYDYIPVTPELNTIAKQAAVADQKRFNQVYSQLVELGLMVYFLGHRDLIELHRILPKVDVDEASQVIIKQLLNSTPGS